MTYLKTAALSALPALALAVTCLVAPNSAKADADPFIGEIGTFGLTFCPRGWASTEGQLLPISQNDALFSLLGTTFGGDGRTTFGLPDLRGRIPIGLGNGPGLSPKAWGAKAGQEQINLSPANLASHSHAVNATNADGDKAGPGDKILAAAPDGGVGAETIYSDQAFTVQMNPAMISPTGGNLALNTQDPTLVVRYCIALQGVYPSRN